ncbi:hypothetical protein [Paenibacillus taichungensis]
MKSLERKKILKTFVEGERVNVTTNRTVDHMPIDPNLTYIFNGHNHDYEAILIAEGEDPTWENQIKIDPAKLVKCKVEATASTSAYGLDLEKVELRFVELVTTGDDNQLAEYAKQVIPLLLNDARRTRAEVVNGLLNRSR